MIKLESVNIEETMRYLGNSKVKMNEAMENLFSDCEKEVLQAVNPKYLYKTIDLDNRELIVGKSIKTHLKDCKKAVVLCGTLGFEVDRLIRTTQITDMAKAVVIDAMASALIEQVMAKLDLIIAKENKNYFITWRFSPGYGDYPINLQETYLRLLDAPRKIGLCTNENSILTPVKSVTAIIGLSEKPLDNKRKGCGSCNLVKTCKFRKVGTRCDV